MNLSSEIGARSLCRKLDLFGRELLAVDGTRLKAVNNPGRNFSRDKLARYIAAPS